MKIRRMKQPLLLCLPLILLLIGPEGCKPSAPTTTQSDNGFHLVVAIQGQLRIKRAGWNRYVPALFGTEVRRGDLLSLSASSQVTIACADFTVMLVTSELASVPCNVTKPDLIDRGSRIERTRGDSSGQYPVVLSPRKTKLLNSHPILRWTGLSGLTTYKISVRKAEASTIWSQDVTSKTEVIYPDYATALIAGETYKLVVSSGYLSSDEEKLPDLGFTLLTPDEAQAVNNDVAHIDKLNLADAPKQFLIANLYATRSPTITDCLNAEAIEKLEILSGTMKEPAIMRSLGRLYLSIGLNRLGETRYLQALNLSQQTDDPEGQALAEYGLGFAYNALGNQSEAQKRFQEALVFYQQVGDRSMTNFIHDQLANLPGS